MNSKFEIKSTSLKDAKIIVPFSADDLRGNFTKDFEVGVFEAFGLDNNLSETFYARNDQKYVVRGMHFAMQNPQAKLVRCLCGEIYDVIVDLRPDSPTYLKWEGFYLSETNGMSLYVPKGFAHGYLSITKTLVSYKCFGKYDAKYDAGVVFNDPTFAIKWPIDNIDSIIISAKDKALPYYESIKDKIII